MYATNTILKESQINKATFVITLVNSARNGLYGRLRLAGYHTLMNEATLWSGPRKNMGF